MKKIIKCLLIDDDTDDRDFFSLAINHLDAEIQLDYSPSGEHALHYLEPGANTPDYIFLDLNMMPMSGIETLTEIKKIASCVDIPVIIYSTTINETIKYKTLALGAFDHFVKPSSKVELEAYLKRLLQVH